MKISENFTNHVPHLDELYNKKAFGTFISISKDVKHPLYRFLNESRSNRIDGFSHIYFYYDKKQSVTQGLFCHVPYDF